MTILDQIVAYKYREVKERKSFTPVRMLEKTGYFSRNTISLRQYLLREELSGIISEFKRKSPARGTINVLALPGIVCHGYEEAGSSAVSVLTDTKFFGGSSADLIDARSSVDCPVLRKDFIVDEYQITEARSIGADAVLLIAELHQPERLEQLHRYAHSLQLEVLVEVYDERNISRIPYDAQLIGVNSRNLDSFCVSLDHLARMVNLLPGNVVKVAESGIKSATDYMNLKNDGYDAFLIGEFFMSTENPGKTCEAFIREIKQSREPGDGASINL